MEIDLAQRLSEMFIGFAVFQQSLECLRASSVEKNIALVRAPLAILLMLGFFPELVLGVLVGTHLLLIWRFRGPYNGGSDTMSLLVLLCLWFAQLAPSRFIQELALGYLALQLVICYFQAGWVKLMNPEWRTGKALCEVFAFTAYPVSESLRALANYPGRLFFASWLVILGELFFPFALMHSMALGVALVFTGAFHLANALLFGLNRFFWSWLAAYPIIIWFQQRLMELL